MGGKITALKVQKRDRQRVNVHLDGRFAFGLAIIQAARLRVGQSLSDKEIAQLRELDDVERAANRALDLLSYRPRSRTEVRRRLKKHGFDEHAIEEALHRLSNAGLLDDQEFARYWVENRFQFNPRGTYALRQELWQKGVADETIDQVLSAYDEDDAVARAAQAAVRKLKGLDPASFRRKLIDHLRRRGFHYAVIEPVATQALAEYQAEGSFEENGE